MPARVEQEAPLVVVANRPPATYRRGPDGRPSPVRGGGGLVSSLAPLLDGTGATWIGAAMTEVDRELAALGPRSYRGMQLELLAIDPEVYELAYDTISNATLWFALHGLFDRTREPTFNRSWRRAWDAYRALNARFAEAAVQAAEATPGSTVLVQDYHLFLTGTELRRRAPRLPAVHFTHTPFPTPEELAVLPDDVAVEILRSLGAFSSCGFHTERWRSNFAACCDTYDVSPPETFVAPLAPDAEELEHVLASERCQHHRAVLAERTGGRRTVLRVDRIEPSKNILRGFLAFEELLRSRPDLSGEVVFLAMTYPSRQSLPGYRAYRAEVERCVERVNASLGHDGWQPIQLEVADDFPRSLAALSLYDVLVVNPIRDGLNLVAKEGPLVNARNGTLVLSREAGVSAELGSDAFLVNPFDVSETAAAIGSALDLDAVERARRAKALAAVSRRRTPRDWLDDQRRSGQPGVP